MHFNNTYNFFIFSRFQILQHVQHCTDDISAIQKKIHQGVIFKHSFFKYFKIPDDGFL
jgi:hypothetical protein